MDLAEANKVRSYAVLMADSAWRYKKKVSTATNKHIGTKMPINKVRRKEVARFTRGHPL